MQFLPESWVWEALAAGARRGHYLRGVLIPDVAVASLDGIDLLQACLDSSTVHCNHLQTWSQVAQVWKTALTGHAVGIDPSIAPVGMMYNKVGSKMMTARELAGLSLTEGSVAIGILPTNLLSSPGIFLAEYSASLPLRIVYLPFSRTGGDLEISGIKFQESAREVVVFLEKFLAVKIQRLKIEFLEISGNPWLTRISSISTQQVL